MRSPGSRWAAVITALLLLVLLPLPLIGGPVDTWIEGLLQAQVPPEIAGPAVVGLLTVDVFAPIPSSVVATLAGVTLGFGAGAAAVWLGLSLGCVVAYAVGWSVGTPGLRRFVGEDELARARAWAEQRGGGLGLALSRPVPMLAEASLLLAGAVRARPSHVAWVCALSNLGIALAYAAVGALAVQWDLMGLALFGSLALPGVAMLAARLAQSQARTQP